MSREKIFQKAKELSIEKETNVIIYRIDNSYGYMLLEQYGGRTSDIIAMFFNGYIVE